MRYLLAVICFFGLVTVSPGAWTDISEKDFLKTPWAERPRVEQSACIDCHASELIKADYQKIPGEWRQSWHYQNRVACQDCHGGDPKDAAKSMTPESGFIGVPKPKQVPEFCGKCHIGIMENYLESGHGKALMTTGRGPNCVLCHGSHNIQKASIDIISPKLCGVCHKYDRAKDMKASLLLTEQKINDIGKSLETLKAGLISTQDEDKVLFQTQAEFRTLFHTVDVKLVQEKTGEFSKRLNAINDKVLKGFGELKFRQDFAVLIMLIFIGLGITIFLLGRKSA
jgi:nitrate/TMAO reductase-like tetraheme cytochrome c subunit